MSKLLRTIRRLKSPPDLWLFLQILWMLIFLPRRIRSRSMPELLADIDPGVAGGPRNEDKLQKTVGFIDSLLKYRIFQRYGKCLLRSLVLFKFLRLQGWPVEIHFGVRKTGKEDTDIIGHSWLVLEGEPFLEYDNADHFTATYIYSSF